MNTRSLMAWDRILCALRRACQTRELLQDKELSFFGLIVRHVRLLFPGREILRELLVSEYFTTGFERRGHRRHPRGGGRASRNGKLTLLDTGWCQAARRRRRRR